MAKPNLPLIAYELLDLIPIICVFIVLFILFLAFMIGIRCCISHNKLELAVSAFKKFIKGLTKLTMIVFGPPLGVVGYEAEKDEKVDHLELPVVFIHKQEVPKHIVCMLGGYVIFFITFSITVFWDIFLLAQSSDCDDTTIDCFASNGTGSGVKPVMDCGLYESYGSNVTIICYSFAYSFGPALGAIGGLFTMIKIVMKGISSVFLNLYGYAIYNKKRLLYRSIRLFQICFTVVVAIVIPITIIVINYISDSLSFANIVQVLLAMFTMILGFSIPWAVFIVPVSDDLEEENNSGSNEEKTPIISPGGDTSGHGTINAPNT